MVELLTDDFAPGTYDIVINATDVYGQSTSVNVSVPLTRMYIG